MTIRLLPLITGLMPIFGIHTCYLIAIHAGRVPACVPYLSGCTSISATGRYPPASYLFKAFMLPEAVLLLLFWVCSAAWLEALEARSNAYQPQRTRRLTVPGAGGALALIIYVTFLGTQEPFYEFMRRFGIYVFFLLTILAQLELSVRLKRYAIAVRDQYLLRLARLLLALVTLPFLLGVLNLSLKAVFADADRSENVIEWIVVLIMQSHLALTYFAWRATGFSVQVRVPQN